MSDRLCPVDPARGALVVVYRRRGEDVEYLLLRRTGVLSGDWAWGPPAGAREAGEDADAGAVRELREETGLCLAVTRTDAGSAEWPVYLAEAAARTAPDVVRAGLLGAAALLGDPAAEPDAPPVHVLGMEDDVPLVPTPNELSLVLTDRLPPADPVTAALGLIFDGDRLLMTPAGTGPGVGSARRARGAR
jgi:8-oxo-dGTP pyrophosphatase MutT (NUDIX family)